MQATIVMPAGRAAVQARAHQGLWRRGRAVRPRPRGPRSHRRATSPSKRGATLVRPYDDPFVIAGQGTVGREIAEDMAALGLDARYRGGAGLRRRPDRGRRDRGQGALSAGQLIVGRARRLRRSRASRCAPDNREAAPRRGPHHLRCADGLDPRRNHLRDQQQAAGAGRHRVRRGSRRRGRLCVSAN